MLSYRILAASLFAVLPLGAITVDTGNWPDDVLFAPAFTLTFDTAADHSPGSASSSLASIPGVVTISGNGFIYNYWSSLSATVGNRQDANGSTIPGRGVLLAPWYGSSYLEIALSNSYSAISLDIAELNNPGMDAFAGSATVQLYGAGWLPLSGGSVVVGPNPTLLVLRSEGRDIRGVRIASNAPSSRPVIDNFAAGDWALPVPEPGSETLLFAASLLFVLAKLRAHSKLQ